MVAVKVSKPNEIIDKENEDINDAALAMSMSQAMSELHPRSRPFPSRSGIFLAVSNGDQLPSDCHGILEQAAQERCHGNNGAYVHCLNRLARCSSENEQLSCHKKCREEVLKQADFIADYGVVLEGLASCR